MESTEGIAPELTTHKEGTMAAPGDDLSPEEEAVQGVASGSGFRTGGGGIAEEDDDTAALAEGRAIPPGPSEPA